MSKTTWIDVLEMLVRQHRLNKMFVRQSIDVTEVLKRHEKELESQSDLLNSQQNLLMSLAKRINKLEGRNDTLK